MQHNVGKPEQLLTPRGLSFATQKRGMKTAELKAGYNYNNDYFYILSQHNVGAIFLQ